jgi:hypothetical protein
MRLSLEQRTAALLALVEDYRARRCAALIEPAQEQAQAILRAARAEGRRRVHAAIGELRQRLAAEVGAAQARLATERRLAEQRQAMLLLGAAWSELREALRRRWRDPAARALWIESQLQRALRVLSHEQHAAAAAAGSVGAAPPAERHRDDSWHIEYAADWPAAERDSLVGRVAEAGVTVASALAREDTDGGLRIRAGANVVDATIDGLLADRAAIEGRLLDLLRAAPGGPPPDRAAQRAERKQGE